MVIQDMMADRGTGEPISLGAALMTGKKVPPDVTGLLMEDHRTVMGWFDWFASEKGRNERSQILRNILKALAAHMAAEEDVFYPEAARCIRDPALVDRAVREHQHAKAIMARLEGSTDDPAASLVNQLRSEIETHVQEEETQLFPLVRESGMDLYANGTLVTARRADVLFRLSRPQASLAATDAPQLDLTEMPPMPIDQTDAKELFIAGLRNIHGAVNHGLQLVQTQLNRLEHYPQLKAKLQIHQKEKEAQLDRIERILSSLGGAPSTLKDIAGSASAMMGGMTAAMADDEILKNSFTTYGLANFEAAAYESLILLAQASSNLEAMPLLQQSLSEERGMACFIAENLRATGIRFLELRSEGRQASH